MLQRFAIRYFVWLAALGCGVSAAVAAPSMVDLDGDGMSDVWQLAFDAFGLDGAGDEDGDGFTNAEESALGTAPRDASSRFVFEGWKVREGGLELRFEGAAGQNYFVETSEDLVNWSPSDEAVVSAGGATELLARHDGESVRFMRFRVGADRDGDGISDYEEELLGYDSLSRNSGFDFVGGDLARVVASLTSGEALTVGERQVEGRLPTLEESSRFLAQAALGATLPEIERVAELGFAAWIEEQIAEEPGLIEPGMEWWYRNEENLFFVHRRYAWWEQVMTSPDLLRQRLAVALSEIYVVSDAAIDGEASTRGMANFYDMLLRNAFGNWRDLLRDVTLHPVMGYYLSHLQNRKADPAANRYPDENYAREIMQLFSIGLFELNPDGTRRKDGNGEDIPTYDNGDITNFARVFTGLSYGGPNNKSTDWWAFYSGQWVWNQPMKAWIGEHDVEAKALLRGEVLPAFADAPGRVPMDDVEDAIDNLFEHPNVGPFICYRLIQRLVKSNPTPEYVARVSAIFGDNGRGVRGDLRAVTTAILLDTEARSLGALKDPHGGRLREPYLRWVRLVKSLRAESSNGTFLIPDWSHLEEMGQRVMSSNSVFNFYLPDFEVAGEMLEAGLVGPEFQILTATTAMATQNIFGSSMMWSFGLWDDERPGDQMRFNFTEEQALLASEGLEAVIDRLDLILTYGQLREDTKEIMRTAYNGRPNWFDQRLAVALLVRIVMLSPEFAVAL